MLIDKFIHSTNLIYLNTHIEIEQLSKRLKNGGSQISVREEFTGNSGKENGPYRSELKKWSKHV
jgi:hypothetical protein